MEQGEISCRFGELRDIPALISLFNMSFDGMAEVEWAREAGPGESWRDVARRQMQNEDDELYYGNCLVVVDGDKPVSMLIFGILPEAVASSYMDLAAVPAHVRPFTILRRLGAGQFYLRNAATFPEYRNRCFFSGLIEMVIQMAWKMKATGVCAIVHETNTALLAHYKRRGFEEIASAEVEEHVSLPLGSKYFLLSVAPGGGLLSKQAKVETTTTG